MPEGDPGSDLRAPGPYRPVPAGTPEALVERRLEEAIQSMLAMAHRHNAKAAIEGPDEHGAFPASHGRAWGLGTEGVPPLVLDANPLRGDVIRACRNGRTVLVTAANAGALRLYAASHVIEEVAEHAERWAWESGDVSLATFQTCWEEEYLPLVRVIEDEWLSEELLGGEERARLCRLIGVDPDDAPSVILALSLDAFFLSEDRRAVQAVYGEEIDLSTQRSWLARLRSSGDAGELAKMVFAAAMVPTLAVGGTIEAGRFVARRLSPWALLPIGTGLIALAYRHVGKERWASLGGGVGKLALGFMYLQSNYLREYERFRAAAPQTPRWDELAREIDRHALLQRACMHALARSPDGCLSASALADSLPTLDIGQGDALVREVLRGSGCFHQPYAGRWQLGEPAVPRT